MATTLIDANGLDRVFHASAGSAVLENLTMQNGSACDGGGIVNTGTLALLGVVVRDSVSLCPGFNNFGGGVFNGGTLTVDACTIAGNTGRIGGGIANVNATAVVTNSTITNNTAVFVV